MVRISIQVRELISSNVSSALDAASNPAKMLAHLQHQIEDALVDLHGEVAKARRQKERAEAQLDKLHWTESDWADKARVAMDHDREDLARQALMAREDCRAKAAEVETDIARIADEIGEMEQATGQLEAKREEVRRRLADQRAATANGANFAATGSSRTERRLDAIDALEKRTAFATEDTAPACTNAAVEREIEQMRRERSVEEELAAMRMAKGNASSTKKGGKRSKAA